MASAITSLHTFMARAVVPETLIKIPLLPFEKRIVCHGIMSAITYLFLLPLGFIVARYARTFTRRWFTAHWIIQFVISGPMVIASFALARRGVTLAQSGHWDDTHKKWGLAIFILYWSQFLLGVIIHFWKPRLSPKIVGRPIQNYLHPLLGIFIVAASYYQVRYGFRVEWPLQTGRRVGNGANIMWWIWVFLVPIIYFAGVVFLLPRQYRQERAAREEKNIPTAGSSGENVTMNQATDAPATY